MTSQVLKNNSAVRLSSRGDSFRDPRSSSAVTGRSRASFSSSVITASTNSSRRRGGAGRRVAEQVLEMAVRVLVHVSLAAKHHAFFLQAVDLSRDRPPGS